MFDLISVSLKNISQNSLFLPLFLKLRKATSNKNSECERSFKREKRKKLL